MGDRENLIVAARLTTLKGFAHMGEVMPIVGELQNQGIDAICEAAPGSPLEGAPVFYIKVPESQLAEAQPIIEEQLKK